MIDPNTWIGGLLMLVVLFTAFTAMAAYRVPQPLAMALTACIFLAMQAHDAEAILRTAFSHFADIAVLFTAVAIPAHMIERSGTFRWVQGITGAGVGRLGFERRHLAEFLIVAGILASTYVLAGIIHNVTSILVMTALAIHLCDKFKLPSRYVLCGMLAASNLGAWAAFRRVGATHQTSSSPACGA
jgi:Na+/H+ antiporter NhaD/arsenite permease-like protein